MGELDGLIRYRKHTVDEKQKVLSNLYRQSEDLEKQKARILAEMEAEKKVAREAEEREERETSAFLLTYLEGARAKVRALDGQLARLEVRIIAAQEEVRSAFAEQKKVEIVQKQRQKKEDSEVKAKESKELDEIAIDAYRKQGLEDDG